MRCKVQLYVAGKVFDEYVEARDYQEARQVALARNPNAKVIGVTAVFENTSNNFGSSSSTSTSSSDSSSSGSGEGILGLALIFGGIWALMSFLPLILMGVGGWFGAWAGNKTGKVSMAIVLSLLAGGFGYYQGDQWQQQWNSGSGVEEVQLSE